MGIYRKIKMKVEMDQTDAVEKVREALELRNKEAEEQSMKINSDWELARLKYLKLKAIVSALKEVAVSNDPGLDPKIRKQLQSRLFVGNPKDYQGLVKDR